MALASLPPRPSITVAIPCPLRNVALTYQPSIGVQCPLTIPSSLTHPPTHSRAHCSRPPALPSRPQAGEITLPPKGELFYLSQRPYLVSGTLRDQLLYPEPPRAVWEAASERTKLKANGGGGGAGAGAGRGGGGGRGAARSWLGGGRRGMGVGLAEKGRGASGAPVDPAPHCALRCVPPPPCPAHLQIEPWMKSRLMGEEELEERLCECLEAVELDYLLAR